MIRFIDKILNNLGRIIGLIILINGVAVAIIGLVFIFLLLLASNHANEFKTSVLIGNIILPEIKTDS